MTPPIERHAEGRSIGDGPATDPMTCLDERCSQAKVQKSTTRREPGRACPDDHDDRLRLDDTGFRHGDGSPETSDSPRCGFPTHSTSLLPFGPDSAGPI